MGLIPLSRLRSPIPIVLHRVLDADPSEAKGVSVLGDARGNIFRVSMCWEVHGGAAARGINDQ